MKGSSRKRGIAITTLAVAFLLAACGSNEETPTACTPGDSKACVGPGACAGGQVCRADGSGYGACDCGVGSDGGAGADASDASGSSCPTGLPGPELVEVPAIDGTRYCIDATEVTFADYDAFMAAIDPASTNLYPCPGDTNYYPQVYCMQELEADLGGAQPQPDWPAVCINFCQASAYCQWAGKRLCGKIGGGSLPFGPCNSAGCGPFPDESTSEWANVCNAGGTKPNPWGGQPAPCDYTHELYPVKSQPECSGGFPGVYGMLTNAAEWENACSVEGADPLKFPVICSQRGDIKQDCNDGRQDAWGASRKDVGFRCCHD